MLEKDFQGWVIDVFTAEGWDVKHCPTPMRPIGGNRFVPDPRGRGMLDLLMTHDDPPRLVFAECKAHGGELSDAQREQLRRLRAVAEVVRERFRPEACPVRVFLFQPGSEAMIEAVARGAQIAA